jgi:hypothetical protein
MLDPFPEWGQRCRSRSAANRARYLHCCHLVSSSARRVSSRSPPSAPGTPPITGGVFVMGTRAAVVARKVEQYRQLPSECRRVAKTLSPGDRRALLEMAEQWNRLADQQERTTDLGHDAR